MADADPRTLYFLTCIKDTHENGDGTMTIAFHFEGYDNENDAILYGDFSSIYTESLAEAGAIVYPSFMGYIMTLDLHDGWDPIIISIVDHSDDTVYSAYLTEDMIASNGVVNEFTEGDTPPDPDADGGDEVGQS